MSTEIRRFRLLPVSFLAEAAEANVWHDDFIPAITAKIAAFESAGLNIETAGRNIGLELASTEVADQAAAQ